jgi:hypothetical protein
MQKNSRFMAKQQDIMVKKKIGDISHHRYKLRRDVEISRSSHHKARAAGVKPKKMHVQQLLYLHAGARSCGSRATAGPNGIHKGTTSPWRQEAQGAFIFCALYICTYRCAFFFTASYK